MEHLAQQQQPLMVVFWTWSLWLFCAGHASSFEGTNVCIISNSVSESKLGEQSERKVVAYSTPFVEQRECTTTATTAKARVFAFLFHFFVDRNCSLLSINSIMSNSKTNKQANKHKQIVATCVR
jgi:hypothetical protein